VSDAGEGLYILDARMHIEEAESLLNIKLPEGEYETVGGFVLEQLARVPKKGESFQYNDFQVAILEGTERAVTRVKFKLNPRARKGAPKRKMEKEH
jgi:CBS domain containing-hemolysin-like protein